MVIFYRVLGMMELFLRSDENGDEGVIILRCSCGGNVVRKYLVVITRIERGDDWEWGDELFSFKLSSRCEVCGRDLKVGDEDGNV